jgi:hypothetical protein
VPTLQDFDSKLLESDAYLKLLSNQIKEIDEKISASGKESEETVLVDIKVKTLTLIDAIKQTVTLLQQSKSDVSIANGSSKSVAPSPSTRPNDKLSVNGSQAPSGAARPTSSDSVELISLNSIQCGPVLLNPVPETSYSSSEDEDDDYFYDAEENSFAPEKRPSFPGQGCLAAIKLTAKEGDLSLNTVPEDWSQFDACYEEDDDGQDLDNLETQGSVISHILSQMKIGMDLTRVVLPTFILERRSLLEMYADFFAHPDLFVSIADFETPEQRFIQTVRWYMSAFHAGRKSSVAKKPYNPILGEVFKCYWDVPNYKSKVRDAFQCFDRCTRFNNP